MTNFGGEKLPIRNDGLLIEKNDPKTVNLRNYYRRLVAAGAAIIEEQRTPHVYYVTDRGTIGVPYYHERIMVFPSEFRAMIESQEGNLLTIIDSKFREAIETGEEFRLLDVGCGEGNFIIDTYLRLVSQYDSKTVRNHFHPVGLSLYDNRRKAPSDGKKGKAIIFDETGGEYLVGDMRFLRKIMTQNQKAKFDVIVSSAAISWVEPARMRLRVVQQIYEYLKRGGIAALSHVNFFSIVSNNRAVSHNLNQYAKEMGLKVFIIPDGELTHILMYKTEAKFTLPIPYDFNGNHRVGDDFC